MSKVLTRDDLLSFTPDKKRLNVPELVGDVYIRAMTCEEADIEAAAFKALTGEDGEDKAPSGLIFATILLHGLCDEDGNALFEEDDLEKIPAALTPKLLAFLAREIQEFNKIPNAEIVEEEEGNS